MAHATISSYTHYGGFWRRAIAMAVDWLVLWIPYALVSLAYFGTLSLSLDSWVLYSGPRVSLYYFSLFVMAWIYVAVMESSPQQGTLGKMAAGLIVTDKSGNRISFLRAMMRFLAKCLSTFILCIGYLAALFSKRKRTLHDRLAGTLVLHKINQVP